MKRIGRLDLCLHEDEFDFLMELVKFLKPLKNISDLFSTSLPTLSLIPLMKTYIRKNCNVSTEDDDKIKQIKDAVLRKLDVRFPVTDDIKLHQLLDPSTKDLMPRVESTVVLEQAVKSATDRGFMTPSLPRMPANELLELEPSQKTMWISET